jgi:hypothetical protein
MDVWLQKIATFSILWSGRESYPAGPGCHYSSHRLRSLCSSQPAVLLPQTSNTTLLSSLLLKQTFVRRLRAENAYNSFFRPQHLFDIGETKEIWLILKTASVAGALKLDWKIYDPCIEKSSFVFQAFLRLPLWLSFSDACPARPRPPGFSSAACIRNSSASFRVEYSTFCASLAATLLNYKCIEFCLLLHVVCQCISRRRKRTKFRRKAMC